MNLSYHGIEVKPLTPTDPPREPPAPTYDQLRRGFLQMREALQECAGQADAAERDESYAVTAIGNVQDEAGAALEMADEICGEWAEEQMR